ncbi:MAG: hypothetical protein ACRCZI_07325 [Cetobacterium sp.]
MIKNETAEITVVSPHCVNNMGTNDDQIVNFYKTILYEDCIRSGQNIGEQMRPFAIYRNIRYWSDGSERNNAGLNKNLLEACASLRNLNSSDYIDISNHKYVFIRKSGNKTVNVNQTDGSLKDGFWNLALYNTQYSSAYPNSRWLIYIIVLLVNLHFVNAQTSAPHGYGLYVDGTDDSVLYNDARSPSDWTNDLCWQKCAENFCNDKDTKWHVME